MLKIRVYVLLTHYCPGDQMEKNEMSGECSKFVEEESRMQGSGGERLGRPRRRL